MYRVSPFTYLVSAVLSVGLAGTSVKCSDIEILHVPPPQGQNCSSFLDAYVQMSHGRLLNPEATLDCQVCPVADTDTFLAQVSISYSDRWRNVGLLFVYIVFNIFAAIFLYWLIRVPKKRSRKIKEE